MNVPCIICTIAVLLFSGCAHTVEYDLTEQDRAFARKINKVVEVKHFTDKTPRRSEAVVKIDGERWRTNPARGYTDANLSYSVSSMVARHLDHSGLFRDVVYKGGFEEADTLPTGAPLVLTGTITEYSILGRVNRGAELKETVAGFFGWMGRAAGAVANLGEETELRVKITLKDVQLKEVRTGRVLWKDTISLYRKYAEADYETAGARAVYDNADDCLRDAVNELIRRMARKLEHPPAHSTARRKR